jgi:hypothetical protein
MNGRVRGLRPYVLPLGLGAAVVAVLGALQAGTGVGHGLLALAVAGSLVLEVELPRGGHVPLGHAVVMGLALPLATVDYAVVVGLGIGLSVVLLAARRGLAVALHRCLWLMVAAGTAAAVMTALRGTDGPGDTDLRVALGWVMLSSAAYLAVDLVGSVVMAGDMSGQRGLRQAWPVYVTLMCGAALIGLAPEQGSWAVLGAALPLLAIRYSFERFAMARRAYEQTIQALSLVPELGGRAELGHGARSAAYAGALGAALGRTGSALERVVTAARLHHIGFIALGDDGGQHSATDATVAAAGGAILRETAVLADVADVVEASGAETGPTSVDAAIVWASVLFDELVGDDPGKAGEALDLLAARAAGPEAVEAVSALRRLVELTPAVVASAIKEGQPLTSAAAAAGRGSTDG